MTRSVKAVAQDMVSAKVQVLEPPGAIGWLPGTERKDDGHLEFGGWMWRYDLAAGAFSGWCPW